MALPDFAGSMSVAEAVATFPMGTPVRYFPVARERSFVRANVRSEPWALGHGAVVIKITGRVGGVSVQHLARDV